jgi:hypothetical protein
MTFTIDPNLRGVLEDITKSKKSALFAGTYLKNVHQAYTIPDGRFTAMRLGMNSAERHLLAKYRSELSMVLLQSFYRNFFEVEEFAAKVHNLGELPEPEAIEERARFARDSAPREAFVGRTTHWLRRLLEGRPISQPEDLEGMLTAAIGLQDRPEARGYMGHLKYIQEDWAGVLVSLEPLVREGSRPSSRSAEAHVLVACTFSERGMWSEADRFSVAGIRLAWEAGDRLLSADELGNVLVRAGLGGDFSTASQLAGQFDGIVRLSISAVERALPLEGLHSGYSEQQIQGAVESVSGFVGADLRGQYGVTE